MRYNPMQPTNLGMSTGNSSNVAKTAQPAKQNQSRITCKLPRNMTPSKNMFESIGFTFEEIGDDVLYQATLPEGWSLQSDGNYSTYFIDEKGRKRGNYFYKETSTYRSGEMSLCWRFHATCESIIGDDFDGPFKVLVKDSDGTTIFEAGQCKKENSDKYRKLMGIAIVYLNTNYPDWGNPTKYWD